MHKGPSIVFMGTPEFAVESLKAVLDAGYPVKAVITAPDKPSGRGLQLTASPVKEFALRHGLPVLQPLKLKDPEFISELKALEAELQVVVAFRMLPEEVWAMPPLGTFNLHASLLPQYRGAAPINWAVINGEDKTGITTFFLNHEIDKGSLIYREEIAIGPFETAGMVHDRLMAAGAALVVKTIEGIAAGKVIPAEQHWDAASQGPLRPAPKIFKNDCHIDWDKDAAQLFDLIRGLSPYPAAWTSMETPAGETLQVKIFLAEPVADKPASAPGTLLSDGKSYLHVSTGKGTLSVTKLQVEGKKPLAVTDFLRGFSVSGCRFK
jgi:methionyl-tRNA formyltransferase